MKNVSDTIVEKIITHILFPICPENRGVYEIIRKICYGQTGHRWKYSTCALHAGYLKLQIHTKSI